MLSEVGIGPKSLCYGFLNEIVAYPQSEEGPGITRIGCTKFCEGCTKGPKMCSEVGIGLNSLYYGFVNEIMDHLIRLYSQPGLLIKNIYKTYDLILA